MNGGTLPTPLSLVMRLRWHARDRSNLYRSLTSEAADEIERLRVALIEIAAYPVGGDGYRDVAREALRV